ncbi:DUF6694 family lipoprotein [Metapseudomonas otitidis]|uniref:DUF6694 family lipoprotein n=1 Tax=Metapseudomonas otitidis TaxID=319939 RepID=UPI002610DBCB|nr:DUF6694 family lipoprotein [Pseudomonas otitidis]
MSRKLVVLVVAAALLVGCGESKIDGSSEAAAKASIEKIAAGLPAEKKEAFKEAIQVVAFQELDIGAVFSGKKTADAIAGDMYKALDGQTAAQVIAKAETIMAARLEREKQQALAEIKELTEKTAAAETARAGLQQFKVERSRFYISEGEYSFERKPVIELTVVNGTGKPISRAYFKGTLASPGRSVPWVVDDFNYEIPGGLEAGERVQWSLAPNMFSKWGNVKAPADAVFTVEVVRLNGADGNTLFDARGISEQDQKRLADLKQKYQVN